MVNFNSTKEEKIKFSETLRSVSAPGWVWGESYRDLVSYGKTGLTVEATVTHKRSSFTVFVEVPYDGSPFIVRNNKFQILCPKIIFGTTRQIWVGYVRPWDEFVSLTNGILFRDVGENKELILTKLKQGDHPHLEDGGFMCDIPISNIASMGRLKAMLWLPILGDLVTYW